MYNYSLYKAREIKMDINLIIKNICNNSNMSEHLQFVTIETYSPSCMERCRPWTAENKKKDWKKQE